MEARYLTLGDIIVHKNKLYRVRSVIIRKNRVIVQTSGGRLTFKPSEVVSLF